MTRSTRPLPAPEPPPPMATPHQTRLIRFLWRELLPLAKSEQPLRLWIERHYGVSALRFLPAATAEKAIRKLRGLVKRQGH